MKNLSPIPGVRTRTAAYELFKLVKDEFPNKEKVESDEVIYLQESNSKIVLLLEIGSMAMLLTASRTAMTWICTRRYFAEVKTSEDSKLEIMSRYNYGSAAI